MFRPITITAVLNGWIVACGCQTVVYSDRSELIRDLDQYLRDPAGTEQRFLKESVNGAHVAGNPNALGGALTPSHDAHAAIERERNQYATGQIASSAAMTRDRG